MIRKVKNKKSVEQIVLEAFCKRKEKRERERVKKKLL